GWRLLIDAVKRVAFTNRCRNEETAICFLMDILKGVPLDGSKFLLGVFFSVYER
ncbi:hypothetical protein TorRG33x02_342920, partial [Trema orientale]